MVNYTRNNNHLSIRSACDILHLSRTVYYYKPNLQKDDAVINTLLELAEKYPRYGFDKLFQVIRRQGHIWNHKRVHRVYCLLKLNFCRKGKKRLPTRNPEPLAVPTEANSCWSIGFMSDALINGRKFRTFNVLDDYNREILSIEIDTSLPATRVIRTLEQVVSWRGYPEKLRMDNGPEFISIKLADWAEKSNVKLEFIKPGKPTQNSYVERFNRTYRNEVLDFYIFNCLKEVRDITKKWIDEYNTERPHESLGNYTPAEYLMLNSPEVSTCTWN
jgi:putative transposase